jgi:hypothetical protein
VAQPTPAAEKQAQPSMNSVKGQSGSISADKTSNDKEMNDDSGIIASTAQLAPGNREADTTFLKEHSDSDKGRRQRHCSGC